MTAVKEYKGVNIYVTQDGVFYCDCIDNSSDFKKATFKSEKLLSIERGIDSYEGSKPEEKYWYEIHEHIPIIKKKQLAGVRGHLPLFKDRTVVNSYSTFYHESIENNPYFAQLVDLQNQVTELRNAAQELYKKESKLREEFSRILDNCKIQKVNVMNYYKNKNKVRNEECKE